MSPRLFTLLPILFGAATGAALALLAAEPTPPAFSSHVSENREPDLGAASATSKASPETAPSALEPASALSAPGEIREPSKTAEGAPHTSSPKAYSPVFDLPELATKEALLSTEVHCSQMSPEHCEHAAAALDQGKLIFKDPARAKKLRRIALTLYVKQCEKGRAAACARLAEMYEQGILVQPNTRSASALRERVVTLCKTKKDESMCPSGAEPSPP